MKPLIVDKLSSSLRRQHSAHYEMSFIYIFLFNEENRREIRRENLHGPFNKHHFSNRPNQTRRFGLHCCASHEAISAFFHASDQPQRPCSPWCILIHQ